MCKLQHKNTPPYTTPIMNVEERSCRNNLSVWAIYKQAEYSVSRCKMRAAFVIPPLWFDKVVGNVSVFVTLIHKICDFQFITSVKCDFNNDLKTHISLPDHMMSVSGP